MFKAELEKELKKAWGFRVVLEVPPDSELGNYAFPCFPLVKELKKPPVQIASDLAGKVPELVFIDRVETKGPYVNFFLKNSSLVERTLSTVIKEKEKFGSEEKKNRTVIVEFSSPNIAKPFHYGHLRATVIGNALYLLYKSQGYDVVRINHIGDWGTQFGATIVAYKKWGDAKELEKHPINHLVELYQKFHEKEEDDPELHDQAKEWFKKLEDGDKEATRLWKKFREESLKEFRRIYRILGVGFDSWDGESFYNDKMAPIIKKVEDSIGEVDEGALIVRIKGLDAPCIVRKSDGASTYAARDLAALDYRIKNYQPEKIMYVVAADQSLHFRQVFSVARMLGWKGDFVHVPFGLYMSPGGGKLSTRRGTGVLLNEVINDIIALARETINRKNPELKDKESVAQVIAVSAIIFGDLVNDRNRDVVFDEHRILDFEGDTGPYLQYTHARANSILSKAGVVPVLHADMIVERQEIALVRLLGLLPQKIRQAAEQMKPHVVAQYLLEVARAFNEFYHACPVIKSEDNLKESRLMLVLATRQVIANGMRVLGMAPLDEM